jgi:hypothetical protein
MKLTRLAPFLAVCAAVAVMVLVFRPQAQEVEEGAEPTPVSDTEVQMYIKVYTAMQEDHDLTIEQAIAPYHTSLGDFRRLERRVQNEPQRVDQVREALLQDAKTHSGFSEPVPSPTATVTPAAHRRRRSRKPQKP